MRPGGCEDADLDRHGAGAGVRSSSPRFLDERADDARSADGLLEEAGERGHLRLGPRRSPLHLVAEEPGAGTNTATVPTVSSASRHSIENHAGILQP